MANYAVIDATGLVVNMIVWDGNTAKWQPPAGCTVIEDVDGRIGVGFKRTGTNTYTPPPPPPPPQQATASAAKKK